MVSRRRFHYEYVRGDHLDFQAIAALLRAAALPGITEIIPSYTSVLIEFDPARISRAQVQHAVARVQTAPAHIETGRLVTVPVRYDGADLPEVASRLGMPVQSVVELHSKPTYRVYALGFTPGFPFLGDVTPELRLPRRGVPHPRVPANTVAMADFQTGIYPATTPGGWHLLGQALQTVYDPHRSEPFLIHPGDRVRFVPTTGATPAAPTARRLLPTKPHYPFLRVEAAGMLDLVVDAGRFGYAHFGLARSGAIDPVSARIANGLVGNPPGAPLLEMHALGPRLGVLTAGVIATAGRGYTVQHNRALQPPGTSFAVHPGDELAFNFPSGGAAYVAIPGGIASEQFHGSVSVDMQGLIGQPLAAGDVLGSAEPRAVRPGRRSTFCFRQAPVTRVRIVPGPQYSVEAFAALLATPFTVEASSRMGVLLTGGDVPGGQIPSEGNPLGAVQITTAGKPIVLLNDRGSIGGYHKPAIVIAQDLPALSAVPPGHQVQFVAGKRHDYVL